MADKKDSNSENGNDSNVVSIDDGRHTHPDPSELSKESLQQPLEFNDGYSMDNDADTQDLLRAIQEGEYPDLEYEGAYPDAHDDFPIPDVDELGNEHEIPVTAAEKSAEIRGMIEELAGEQPEEEPDEEQEDEEKLDNATNAIEPLPDMEIKAADQVDPDVGAKSPEGTDVNGSEPPQNDNLSENKVESDKIPFDDRGDDSGRGDADGDNRNKSKDLDYDDELVDNRNQQPQQMVQTNLAGGIGHAFGSVINGVFSGIGMALGSGLAAIKQTKDALNVGSDPSVSTKFEAGAHFHFSPAAQAVNDSFNDDVVSDWKQNRIDTEFASLQMDMDSHLRSIDKMKKTEWAQKLKSIEESGDPEMMAKAPAILNMAKAKSDFKDADRDMNYFLDHIQQRSERLSSMINDSNVGSERLESLVTKWKEDAKKSLDEIPESKEGHGFFDRIQNAAQNILASLRSMFAKPSSSASMG